MPRGRTFEEAVENVKDVISPCLADLRKRREEVPERSEIVGFKRVEVVV